MTDAGRTVRQELTSFPIRLLEVEVVAGPDAGKRWIASSDILTIGTARNNHVVLSDPTVSRYHVELSCRDDGVLVIDHGSTNGTFAGTARIERGSVPAGTMLTLGSTRLRVADGGNLSVDLHDEQALRGICGGTPMMRRLMAQIRQIGASDTEVLISGESGTGKELIARALHDLGPRASQPFVTVDCGALSPTLVASELFGHERGAFTGAQSRHEGAFERADGGTIFLDEIGELNNELQATLLGVLERRRFRRVGGTEEIAVNVRVISATHHDLRAEVNARLFRLDLYYRLAVVVLTSPPLREHPADIPLLAEHFLADVGQQKPLHEVVPPETMQTWQRYRWPGNVRELRNAVMAALATGSSAVLPVGDVANDGAGGDVNLSPSTLDLEYNEARQRVIASFEGQYFGRLLEKAGGNVSQAARTANMNRSHLSEILQRLQLRRP